MKIEPQHIIIALTISVLIIFGIGSTAQIILPNEEYVNSFYNNGLKVVLIWVSIVGIISLIVSIFKYK